ncbi:Glycosyl hydrolase family 20, catalytic domain [Pedobacter sp. ok626]|nr:Glycosyl hydrolase family 20, catalytic domain [Pedobacter sp. ok626]
MLDVARNFQTKKEIFKLIDLLALYKLNTLHFHFSDDEGWRLEIPSLPELTAVGAKRGHTIDENNHLRPAYGSGPDPENAPGSGFYSRLDFIEILKGKERLTEFGQSNIVGLQSQIWSEKIHGADELEYMLLPKLLGFAERAWAARPDWDIETDAKKSEALYQKAWGSFVRRLGQRDLPRLDHYAGGFNYRIPAVGLKVIADKVMANIQLPGFTIRYTTDGTEPDLKSPMYSFPISKKGLLTFRAFNSFGRGGRSTSIRIK